MDEPNQPIQSLERIHKFIPPGWITKTQAVELLNRSVKTFEQIIRQHGVTSELLENKGKRATPIYLRETIESLVRPAAPSLALTKPNQSIQRANQPINQPTLPPYLTDPDSWRLPSPTPSIDRLHLVTVKQAHALGYPYALLREWKQRPNPPGVRYGKSGFRFSVPALRREVERLGVGLVG